MSCWVLFLQVITREDSGELQEVFLPEGVSVGETINTSIPGVITIQSVTEGMSTRCSLIIKRYLI